jgi:hypothetical protein
VACVKLRGNHLQGRLAAVALVKALFRSIDCVLALVHPYIPCVPPLACFPFAYCFSGPDVLFLAGFLFFLFFRLRRKGFQSKLSLYIIASFFC